MAEAAVQARAVAESGLQISMFLQCLASKFSVHKSILADESPGSIENVGAWFDVLNGLTSLNHPGCRLPQECPR